MRTLSGLDFKGNRVTFEFEVNSDDITSALGYTPANENHEHDLTKEKVTSALGYTPADSEDVTKLQEEIVDHKNDSTTHVTSAEKQTWNNKSNFSGSYNDLNDKPTIPTVPTSLKNPYKLTISLGDSSYTYDGSKAVSITIEDGSEVIY